MWYTRNFSRNAVLANTFHFFPAYDRASTHSADSDLARSKRTFFSVSSRRNQPPATSSSYFSKPFFPFFHFYFCTDTLLDWLPQLTHSTHQQHTLNGTVHTDFELCTSRLDSLTAVLLSSHHPRSLSLSISYSLLSGAFFALLQLLGSLARTCVYSPASGSLLNVLSSYTIRLNGWMRVTRAAASGDDDGSGAVT